jgi:hypothetical protein
MSSRLREIASSALGRFGIPGIAEVHVCADSDGGAPYQYWKDLCHGNANNFHTDIETALALCTSGRNDVVLLTPDNHTQGDSITWDKNMTHLVGMFPPAMMNQRSRITHNANFTPMIDVTGYGNLIANVYFAYGRGNAANLTCLQVSGDRNSFINCHFLPGNATELDQANFDLVRLNCGEVYFKDCTFGGDTVAWTNGDMIRLYGASDRSCRPIFENCLFIMKGDNNQTNFIETVAGNGSALGVFRNCQFVNIGTTQTLGIDGAGLGNFKLYFDSNCCFYGCSDVVAAAYEGNVIWGWTYGGAAVNTLLGSTYDYAS